MAHTTKIRYAEGLYGDKGTTVQNYPIYFENGKIYFVATRTKNSALDIPKAPSLFEYNITLGAVIEHKDVNPNEYILVDGVFYGMHNDTKNYFVKYDLKTETLTEIEHLKGNDDTRSIFMMGTDLYYYRNIAIGSSDKGLYKVDTTASVPTAVLVTELNGYYMSSAQVVDGKIYFVDAWLIKDKIPTLQSTGNLCMMDLISQEIMVLN